MDDFLSLYGEVAKTALGFFWKAGWAFVLGYTISAMIQAFVPKRPLTQAMGSFSLKSTSLATLFGSMSSSCSFAALATARSLIAKGAHFIAGVAFMFASTNLVIELGILILIFLGWQFLAAELLGGLLLIGISSALIRLTYPRSWLEAAREKVEAESTEEESFDWKQRIRSADGWDRVGKHFVMEWRMVWQEILIGFTIAGFVAACVPDSFFKAIFLTEQAAESPGNFLLVLENAAVAPFVAALTFIGSMGNIPLATVLNSGGVLFGGIMGFIYSDLMVPPLVKVNAKYYGWRVALYIAGGMYASVLMTSVLLHYGFLATGLTPESSRTVSDVVRFRVDYTLFLNVAAIVLVGTMLWLWRRGMAGQAGGRSHGQPRTVQGSFAYGFLAILLGGCVAWAVTGGLG